MNKFKNEPQPSPKDESSLDEKLAIGCKAAELWDAGDKEGHNRLMRSVPISP